MFIYVQQKLGKTHTFQINGSDGVITPGEDDKVRVRIGRIGEDAKLEIESGSPTDDGSSVTKGATNTLRLDATDLEGIDPGLYTLFVDYFDSTDSNEYKNVDRQVLFLEGASEDLSS